MTIMPWAAAQPARVLLERECALDLAAFTAFLTANAEPDDRPNFSQIFATLERLKASQFSGTPRMQRRAFSKWQP